MRGEVREGVGILHLIYDQIEINFGIRLIPLPGCLIECWSLIVAYYMRGEVCEGVGILILIYDQIQITFGMRLIPLPGASLTGAQWNIKGYTTCMGKFVKVLEY